MLDGAPPVMASGATAEGPAEVDEEAGPARLAPAVRRRAARLLLSVWRDVARDLAVAGLVGPRPIRDVVLLEELTAASNEVHPDSVVAFLERLDHIAEGVAGNVSPELAVDVAILAWPRAAIPTA